MRSFVFIFTILSLALTGCATVNRGITDHFRIDSVPQGAKATTTLETRSSKIARRKNKKLKPIYQSCEPTPCAIPLYRRSEFVIKLEQDGYETAEMFITNSSRSGSFTANMAATTAVTTGTVAGGAAIGAAAATALSTASAALVGGTAGVGATLATFGLIPAETAISTGISIATSSAPTYSSSAAAGAAIAPAFMVTGGMLITDAVTGANINLYPNPVVLKMAPRGTPAKIDPNVKEFQKVLAAEEHVFWNCPSLKKQHPSQTLNLPEKCIVAKDKFRKALKARKQYLKTLKKN